MMNRSASISRASSSEHASLSTTASTPISFRSAPGSYMVGMPPPPAQITIVPRSSSHFDRPHLEDPLRRGRRHHAAPLRAVLLERPALLRGDAVRFGLVVHRPHELGRVLERGILRIHLDHREQGRERHFEGEQVPELLLDHVADHPLGLGAEHVEREVLVGLVGRVLEREQPHLRAVAVGDHELVVLRRWAPSPRPRS